MALSKKQIDSQREQNRGGFSPFQSTFAKLNQPAPVEKEKLAPVPASKKKANAPKPSASGKAGNPPKSSKSSKPSISSPVDEKSTKKKTDKKILGKNRDVSNALKEWKPPQKEEYDEESRGRGRPAFLEEGERTRISLYLPTSLVLMAEELAYRRRTNRNDLIKRMMAQYFEKHKKEFDGKMEDCFEKISAEDLFD